MYLVKLIGQPGSFFTDQDPSLSPPAGRGRFNNVKVAEFKDSYTPQDGVRERREQDARNAFASGSVHPTRINPQAVASSTDLG